MVGRRKHSIWRQGKTKLDQVYSLLSRHRDTISSSFASFDSRWAEMHNKAPVLTKLTKDRYRPEEFLDGADYLLKDVEAAVAKARLQEMPELPKISQAHVTGKEPHIENHSLAKTRDVYVRPSHRSRTSFNAKDPSIAIGVTDDRRARYPGESLGDDPSGSRALTSPSFVQRHDQTETKSQRPSKTEKETMKVSPFVITSSPTYIPYPVEEGTSSRKDPSSRNRRSNIGAKEADFRHETRHEGDRYYRSRKRSNEDRDRSSGSRDKHIQSSSRHKDSSARFTEGREHRHRSSYRPKESRRHHGRYSSRDRSKSSLRSESASRHKEPIDSDSRRRQDQIPRRHRRKDSFRSETGSRAFYRRRSSSLDSVSRDRRPTYRRHGESNFRHKEQVPPSKSGSRRDGSTFRDKDSHALPEKPTNTSGNPLPRHSESVSRRAEPKSLPEKSKPPLENSKSAYEVQQSRFKEIFTSTESST